MADGHCFISYSTHDGLDFTRKLRDELEGGDPPISVWYDKADLTPSYEWDSQIVEAIKSSKCVLFLITEDSTKPASNCKTELTFALRYKKPIVPLLIQKKAEQPFLLGTREWIDFTEGFDAGLAKLRKLLRELNEPKGILREMQYLLGDAKHELRRAKGDEEKRIQADVDELKKQIEAQQKIADDPDAAAEQTQKNIQSGLAREQKSESDSKKETFTKFINPPPGVAPSYFQDRNYETEQIAAFLNDAAQRLMTIIGRGGVGKTATICRLLKDLERGVLPDDLGEMHVDGIVYLSEVGSHKVNFANIFYDLCKLLPSDAVLKLDTVYKNPQASTESKMQTLLDNFQGKPVILLLDNFETLVEEKEALLIRDAELDEALQTLLKGTHTAVKVIITTRIPPQTLNSLQPGRQRVHHLELGLAPKYAQEMLVHMDKDGVFGFKSANLSVFDAIYKQTSGLPKALEALVQILASDRFTTLKDLLEMPVFPENVVQAYVGEAFNRLDTNTQKVMQALAVYNRPVTPAALDYLLAPHIPAIDSAPILQRLANMHFARKESGRFYLHPVDREFAFGLIPEKDSNTKDTKEEQRKLLQSAFSKSQSTFTDYHLRFTQHDLTLRAADYFAAARKPRAEWKKLDDLAAQLAEFDLRCAAGDYDTACSVLREFDFDYLFLWGHFRLIIELHKVIEEKISDTHLRLGNLNGLGLAYGLLGMLRKSVTYLDKGVALSKEAKSRPWESVFLHGLGNRYLSLGDAPTATEYFEQALVINREIGNRRGEGSNLSGLGNAYGDLGDARKAIEFYEQALVIDHEIGDRRDAGIDLGNLGDRHYDLGHIKKAINYCEQALKISHEIQDRGSESRHLGNLGGYYIDHEDAEKSIFFAHNLFSLLMK